jgi:hypothetical protein
MNSTFLLVYYRVYTENGLLLPKSAAGTGDPSLGRILGIAVTPPRTVLSLKKHLRVVEGPTYETLLDLYDSCAAPSPMDDKSTISLLTGSGPGSLQHKPLTLVLRTGCDTGHQSAIRSSRDFMTDSDPRYCMQPSIACVWHTIDCNLLPSVLHTVPKCWCGSLQETDQPQQSFHLTHKHCLHHTSAYGKRDYTMRVLRGGDIV